MTRGIARVTIRKAWANQGVWLEFPVDGIRYRIPHDTLAEIVSDTANWLNTKSWNDYGWYHTPRPSKALLNRLQPFALKP